ncbi:hypothetical protein [Vibrio taketomensis]|uniref:hypothetical protein n=1 Tax=Vibrio taketomensis TaxID=2572923 RepID=UPI0018D9B194|nr:hypothetical protein [Vibrio taketomensis]
MLAAKNIIKQDGGVQSFNFELTEWGHVIANLEKGEGVKKIGSLQTPLTLQIWLSILGLSFKD